MSDVAPVRDEPIKVFLVDDHAVVCAGLRAVIERQRDMRVVGEAYDGIDARDAVARLTPHVVIMDLVLPRLGGMQATQQIKRTQPEVQVLVLTGVSDLERVRQVLEAGASGVVLKQSATADLLVAIRRVATGALYLDPFLAKKVPVAGGQAPAVTQPVLSEREAEVLRLLAAGHTAKEMSVLLHVSTRTLETYRARGMEKLALKNRADIVRYAASQGWLGWAR